MSTQLESLGIALTEGFEAAQLVPAPDMVVVGNVMTRGQPVIEALLESRLPYMSGPEWLARTLLKDRWVLAVAGTHGKTTTASLLAWILEHAGRNPGFLIGGVPANFGSSARAGARAVLRHRGRRIRHRVLRQAREVRALPPAHRDPQQSRIRSRRHLSRRGCHPAPVPSPGAHRARQRPHHLECRRCAACRRRWRWAAGRRSRALHVRAHSQALWSARTAPGTEDFSRFEVLEGGRPRGSVHWSLLGAHNMENALAAIAAARHAGVEVPRGDRGTRGLSGRRAPHAAARRGQRRARLR